MSSSSSGSSSRSSSSESDAPVNNVVVASVRGADASSDWQTAATRLTERGKHLVRDDHHHHLDQTVEILF